MIATGGKLYDTCLDCGKLIRVNKPIFGSLHICLTEEEIAAKHAAPLPPVRNSYDYMTRKLNEFAAARKNKIYG